MKTTKYEIELPTLPDGWEIVGYGHLKKGEMFLNDLGSLRWEICDQDQDEVSFYHVARRKRTLADWANEQPLFKALAEIFRNRPGLTLSNPTECGTWILDADFMQRQVVLLGAPPSSGKLTLKDGKWEDAT